MRLQSVPGSQSPVRGPALYVHALHACTRVPVPAATTLPHEPPHSAPAAPARMPRCASTGAGHCGRLGAKSGRSTHALPPSARSSWATCAPAFRPRHAALAPQASARTTRPPQLTDRPKPHSTPGAVLRPRAMNARQLVRCAALLCRATCARLSTIWTRCSRRTPRMGAALSAAAGGRRAHARTG